MSVLTEDIVLKKAASHETLASLKSLNLWGKRLRDVSIVEKLTSATVVSLSVNLIQTLKFFASCIELEELYLR